MWVSAVRIAGNAVQAKHKMADDHSKRTVMPNPAETPASSGLPASFFGMLQDDTLSAVSNLKIQKCTKSEKYSFG